MSKGSYSGGEGRGHGDSRRVLEAAGRKGEAVGSGQVPAGSSNAKPVEGDEP